jgi:phosphomannomutase / phosphoglucomutase
MSIYKACDIRGHYGPELTVAHAVRLGQALRALKGPITVLVGGDGRLSTPELKSALVESLLSSGCDVVDLGTVPTPLFYFARRRLSLETGVMVTASHNPARDNGFKITLGPLPVTTGEMEAVARLMESSDPPDPALLRGTCTPMDLFAAYQEFLAGLAPDLSGMDIVIDCANGMAGLVARRAWEQTGARVHLLLEDVDGNFPAHTPNPAVAKNLELLSREVVSRGARFGIAYDGDADRVAFVDETGRPLTGDQAIVLFAREALKSGPSPIVYDQKCSRIVPDTVHTLGGTPVMELSGHTYIKRAFLERSAAYAGELSGHHFLRAAGGDDALAASFTFASLLKADSRPLSQVVREIPTYPITPDLRIPMAPDEISALMAALEQDLQGEADLSRTDGLRIEFADGWGLVRPSVTEPVVTMRFEGIDEPALKRILARVQSACPSLAGKLP